MRLSTDDGWPGLPLYWVRTLYEIRVQGQLPSRWSKWFAGRSITNLENGQATLTGALVDQAALHRVLARVRDLGLALLAVNCVDPAKDEGANRT